MILRCSHCGRDKPEDAFYRDCKRITGHRTVCKDCCETQRRDYKATHPETIREQQRRQNVRARGNGSRRAWYWKHRESRADLYCKWRYGFTLVEYNAMFVAQGGVCAICGAERTDGKRLNIDHDHSTGRIRGLLCDRCNMVLGSIHDDCELLTNSIKYLQKGK